MSIVTVGSECSLTMTWTGPPPEEGDILLSVPGGSAYQILEMRLMPTGRWKVRAMRLGKGAVAEGDPGVFTFTWNSRSRR